MKKVVSDIFWDFNVPMEGYCNWPYPDVKGLISTGVGNLINTEAEFKILPWRLTGIGNGRRVTSIHEREAEFARLRKLAMKDGKPTPECKFGGGWWAKQTCFRLPEEDIRALVAMKLKQMETHFKARFPEWDTYPADAQLGLMSMCWALGPAFSWPKFMAHLKAQNWLGCAEECKMTEKDNPGVIPRNKKNRQLFINAAAVAKHNLDPEVLYYPQALDVNQEPPTKEENFHTCPTCNGLGKVKA